MWNPRNAAYGGVVIVCLAVLVSNLNATQQMSQPGVLPGPTPVQVVGPLPLAVTGDVAVTGAVAARQAGVWTMRLAEPAPTAMPTFVRRGACYVLRTDMAAGPPPAPVYRVGEVENGWIQIDLVRPTSQSFSRGWINLSQVVFVAEVQCSVAP